MSTDCRQGGIRCTEMASCSEPLRQALSNIDLKHQGRHSARTSGKEPFLPGTHHSKHRRTAQYQRRDTGDPIGVAP